jgi:hypothetical protein
MVDGGFYVTLFSTASQNLFSRNTHSAYTINLARPINLDHPADKWEVGVCEIVYPPPPFATKEPLLKMKNVQIYLDIISPQFIGNRLVRCARTFIYPAKHNEHLFENIYYMPVEKTYFQTITVEILTLEGNKVTFPASAKASKLVLHFRRILGW